MKTTVAIVTLAVVLPGGLCAARERPQAQGQQPPAAAAQQEAARPAAVRVPQGTPIKLKFAQSLTSKHVVVGDRVEMAVAEDLMVDGWVVVPQGTRVLGTVTVGKKKEKYGNAHDLGIQIDYIAMGDRHVKLGGQHSAKGKAGTDTLVAGTFFLGLSGLLIAQENREANIPRGDHGDGVGRRGH